MQLTYPYQNFYDMLEAAASSLPNKTVIFIDDRKVSYKEFLHKVDAFARFLEIEENHIAAVQAELDYITNTGYWFDFKEFDMEEL